MITEFKQYKFILTTLAPVHIGDGQKYTPKEYIYENKKYYFPDMGKVYAEVLANKGTDKFDRWLMQSGNKNNNRNSRLLDVLNELNIKSRAFKGYSIEATGFENAKYNQRSKTSTVNESGDLNEISMFIKDAFGNPYIPGSSLKGALRTILINTHFHQDNNKKNRQAIQWGAKKDQQYDDIFHDIRVSDSKPVELSKLIIVQKWDYSAQKAIPKPLPVFREAIKPLTRIEFTITAEGQEAQRFIENMQDSAKEFYKEYQAFFLSELPAKYVQNNVQYPIYLGAGSGVWTKTLIKEANGSVQQRYIRLKTKMVEKGVMKLTKAPEIPYKSSGVVKSLLKNSEGLYEMGKATFVIEEMS